MARQRHLRNAPITEALVDFRVSQLARPIDEGAHEILKAKLGERFPTVQRQEFVATRLELKGPVVHTESRLRGFLCKTKDELTIAQFRVDGFTYNRLKPYPSWEEILPDAMSLWQLYVELAMPVMVTRVAVRYINHLKLPFPEKGLPQFLVAAPTIPEGYPKIMGSFLTRVTVREPDDGPVAIVTQASEQGLREAELTIILDIDAFNEGEFEPESGRLVTILARLRDLKNVVFFGSLTEDAVRIFE